MTSPTAVDAKKLSIGLPCAQPVLNAGMLFPFSGSCGIVCSAASLDNFDVKLMEIKT